MSVKLSATALTLRCTMIVMACLFLLLAYWKIPALDLDARGLLIGWLLVLAAAGQCAVAAVMAMEAVMALKNLLHFYHNIYHLYQNIVYNFEYA